MGALHPGHASLIKAAAKSGKPVCVSIFVNPTQFGPNEDFSAYPRTFDADVELAEKAGASYIFAPAVEDIYPTGPKVSIHVDKVSEQYEGAFRPGHFEGVATVVAILFNLTRPASAYFGLKDLQQCAVIQAMVDQLGMPLKLKFEPTVREADGLAMSSRNKYLNEVERREAIRLHQALRTLKDTRLAEVDAAKEVLASDLKEHGWKVDYLDLVDVATFSPTRQPTNRMAVIGAAKLGRTRLIDNILMS